MKAGVLAVAAALASGAAAHGNHARRHAHEAFHEKREYVTGYEPEPTCGCTTVYSTVTGAPTIIGVTPTSTYVAPPPPPPTTTSTVEPTSTYVPQTVPTPYATTCPTPGTYTIPGTTITLTTTYIGGTPTPTTYPPGTYTQDDTTTTVTVSDYVIYCPFTSPAPEPTYAPAPEPTYAPAPAPEPTYAPAPAPEPTKEAAPAPPSNSGNSNGGNGGSLGTSGDQWAVTYTPYNNDGSCKSSFEVYADVAMIKLKGFSALRVYSTDCNTLENVGGAAALSGVKMILGIFVSDTGLGGAQGQVDAITAWAKWDQVELIVVGNEAMFNGYCSASELASFISNASGAWKSAGYTGLITTTEPLNILQGNAGALCDVIDVLGANIHPFFNADVTADQAGSFTKSQLDIVDGLCPGKSGIILETGWPMGGNPNGKAVPGVSEQATAIAGIKASVGGKAVMFSFQNDLWKPLGAFNCERSWGMINLF